MPLYLTFTLALLTITCVQAGRVLLSLYALKLGADPLCRSNSSSLAQPMKFSDIISKVLFVGFRPVQRVMSMPEIRAQ